MTRRSLGISPRPRSRIDTVSPSASASVEELVEDHIHRHHLSMFPVTDNGHLVGCLTTQHVRELPRAEWPLHKAVELAEPCNDHNSISPEADALQAFQRMARDGNSRRLVVDHGQLRGVISLNDVSHLISLKLQLEQ